jgi:hypothetical protein
VDGSRGVHSQQDNIVLYGWLVVDALSTCYWLSLKQDFGSDRGTIWLYRHLRWFLQTHISWNILVEIEGDSLGRIMSLCGGGSVVGSETKAQNEVNR